jgi:hypothetical protein
VSEERSHSSGTGLARRSAANLIESDAECTGFVGLYLSTPGAASDNRQVLVYPELQYDRLAWQEA